MKKMIQILSKAKRVSYGVAQNILDYFIYHPADWYSLRNMMDRIIENGVCFCGNIRTDGGEVCPICADSNRKHQIIIVPDIRVLRTLEDYSFVENKPWYQIIGTKSDESIVDGVNNLIANIKHKNKDYGVYPDLFFLLGADPTSKEIENIVIETLKSEFPNIDYTSKITGVQIGIPLGISADSVNSQTLLALIGEM